MKRSASEPGLTLTISCQFALTYVVADSIMMDLFLVEIMLHLIMQTPYNLIEGRFSNRSKEHLTSYLPKSCQRVKCSF